jgi:bifunctional DNA-binding transcriptional regulator/antitoxin component of YhaV-PrlF toxin-antitoxin module
MSLQSASVMEQVAAGLQTKSDKIRALSKAGYTRSQIADFLGIRYQHVRNVLVNDERVAGGQRHAAAPESSAGQDENATEERRHLYPVKSRLEADGQVTIPPAFWRAAGIKEDDAVMISIEGDVIELRSLSASIRRAQDLVRRLVPPGVSLVDELLAERREEAKREDEGA